VATVKSANISSASVHGNPRPLGKLTPRGKKISNECLRRVQGEEEVYGGHEDDEEDGGSEEEEGLLKDEVDELFECEDLPIITKGSKNS
jgi:hypothetical protein